MKARGTPTHPEWREHGVRVVHADAFDPNTSQTPGMKRAAAITLRDGGRAQALVGVRARRRERQDGPHHHGPLESIIYIVSGRAMRWAEALEFTAEAGPGDRRPRVDLSQRQRDLLLR